MTQHKLCLYIVSHFVSPLTSKDYPREIKMAKKIISFQPEESFWLQLDKSRKYKTLAFFLTADGKKFLSEEKNKLALNLKPKEEVSLETNKIGEDKQIKHTVKTVLDFLKQ